MSESPQSWLNMETAGFVIAVLSLLVSAATVWPRVKEFTEMLFAVLLTLLAAATICVVLVFVASFVRYYYGDLAVGILMLVFLAVTFVVALRDLIYDFSAVKILPVAIGSALIVMLVLVDLAAPSYQTRGWSPPAGRPSGGALIGTAVRGYVTGRFGPPVSPTSTAVGGYVTGRFGPPVSPTSTTSGE
jgi:hypothetical protein